MGSPLSRVQDASPHKSDPLLIPEGMTDGLVLFLSLSVLASHALCRTKLEATGTLFIRCRPARFRSHLRTLFALPGRLFAAPVSLPSILTKEGDTRSSSRPRSNLFPEWSQVLSSVRHVPRTSWPGSALLADTRPRRSTPRSVQTIGAFSMICLTLQRFCLERGRVSSMRTLSPTAHSLTSS